MTTDQKRPHDLHLPSTPEALARRIRELLTNVGIIDRVVPGEGQLWLLVGSLAEGLGNATSDVDVLVLVEEDAGPPGALTGAILRSTAGTESLTYRDGVEVNVEVVRWSTVHASTTAFLELAPMFYAERGELDIPLIPLHERRLLHRIRTGLPLFGGDRAAAVRSELLLEMLPIYAALEGMIEYDEYMEDALGMLATDPTGAILAARTAHLYVLQALLACFGETNQNPKWLARLLTRHEVRVPQREVAYRLMFPPLPEGAEHAKDLLEEYRAFGTVVKKLVLADPALQLAQRRVAGAIAYVS